MKRPKPTLQPTATSHGLRHMISDCSIPGFVIAANSIEQRCRHDVAANI